MQVNIPYMNSIGMILLAFVGKWGRFVCCCFKIMVTSLLPRHPVAILQYYLHLKGVLITSVNGRTEMGNWQLGLVISPYSKRSYFTQLVTGFFKSHLVGLKIIENSDLRMIIIPYDRQYRVTMETRFQIYREVKWGWF